MPRGIRKAKPLPEAARIRSQIKELQARLEVLQQRERHATAMLALCRKHELTRADVKWVHDQLPLARITRKHREQKLKANGGNHANP